MNTMNIIDQQGLKVCGSLWELINITKASGLDE